MCALVWEMRTLEFFRLALITCHPGYLAEDLRISTLTWGWKYPHKACLSKWEDVNQIQPASHRLHASQDSRKCGLMHLWIMSCYRVKRLQSKSSQRTKLNTAFVGIAFCLLEKNRVSMSCYFGDSGSSAPCAVLLASGRHPQGHFTCVRLVLL